MVLAVGPGLVDDDLGGGGEFADDGDEFVGVGLEGFGFEAELAPLLEGDDVPMFRGEDFGEGAAAVGFALGVAGDGFAEVAGVAFEGAAAEAGAADKEFFVAGLGDVGEVAEGVVGEWSGASGSRVRRRRP